jgi:drug/metabolite transporter (DMT)-like permease
LNTKGQLLNVSLALLVTLLWSSSFIIIKLGLNEIPPLLFAGSRYLLAFLIILPFLLTKKNIKTIRSCGKKKILRLFLLGFVFYTLTQGLLFLGLVYLQSATVSLILNLTPLLVAFASGYIIKEVLSKVQWTGLIIFITGLLIYFLPGDIIGGEITGIIIMIIAVGTNAMSALLGRSINREGDLPAIIVTGVSMGFGSLLLFIPSVVYYGIPEVSMINIVLFLWMAAVNTSIAFTLWNKTQRILSAAQSSIINSTMLFQVALLAWFFLDEPIHSYQFIGMVSALTGALLVQLYNVKRISEVKLTKE